MQFGCEGTDFFAIRGPLNMKHKIILSILAILLSFPAFSGPARTGTIYLLQPDGTTFCARLRGDEFMKIYTTEHGNSIIRDKNGWWCYAGYDAGGMKFSSGCRVGHEAPADVLDMSTKIPFGLLAANAGRMRGTAVADRGEPLMRRVMRNKGAGTKTAGSTITKHGIIILAQFNDQGFTHSREDFVRMLTQKGYDSNGATGSAKEYFDAQFEGRFEFAFDVSPIVTLPGNMAYYGGNGPDDSDNAPEQMIIDACRLVDNEIDFSVYDDDGDGEVDNVFVFFAGGDESEGAGDDRIWSHAWYILDGAGKELILDGKRINRYACTAELSRRYASGGSYRDVLAGIGTFCHEYFHTFDIPDMYDTDYEGSGGTSAGLWGSTSLMDAGNQNNYGNTPPYLNAIERELLGISEPVVIETNGGYTLEPIHLNGKVYRLNTDNVDEYYLLECRAEEGWDRHIGGKGLLVYHIDKSDRSAGVSDIYGANTTAKMSWDLYNEVNTRPDHQCADLIEADTRQDGFSAAETESLHASQNNIRSVFFPCATSNSLTPGGRPGFSFWSGDSGEISLTNIRETGDGIAFNVIGFDGVQLPPEIASFKADPFADAAIIRFESDRQYSGEAIVEWGIMGSDRSGYKKITVKPYKPGQYSFTLEGLEPGNKTYAVIIWFELDGLAGHEMHGSFMTKKEPAVGWPYIYMGGVVTNADGTLPFGGKLPLRVHNAGGAAEITWTFNGKTVEAGGDGYFTVENGGILKAHIQWEDGSEDIIEKEIIIGKEETE